MIASVITTINNYLVEQKSEYRCKTISWNDVSRYTTSSGLSSMGSNIQDARLVTKDTDLLYTIRPENWNEKVGTVSASEIAIIDEIDGVIKPMTLKQYLDANNFSMPHDNQISIRFQTTFLPVSADDEALEFCPEVYSYNTPSPDNPRNLLLLATTQGLALYKNTTSYQKLFLVDGDQTKWMSAETTKYKVGAQQMETDEEAAAAISKGKAASAVIGTRGMGQRFNALLSIQIPVKQKIAYAASTKMYVSKGGIFR